MATHNIGGGEAGDCRRMRSRLQEIDRKSQENGQEIAGEWTGYCWRMDRRLQENGQKMNEVRENGQEIQEMQENVQEMHEMKENGQDMQEIG